MTEWWQEMFDSPAWQAVQLGWESAEDAEDQVARIERALRLTPGMRVLDVPCGTGRIASRLAARGYDVVGVDLTERFLEEAVARGDGVRYERGDMRALEVGDGFDAALCFWGSFGYFDRGCDLAQARAAADALVDGGRYLIDVPTMETVLPRFRDRSWFEVEDTVALQETAFVPGTGRIETVWTFLRGAERVERRTSVHLYALRELTDLLHEAGFSGFEAFDDDLEPFEVGAHRLWLVATK
jgi:SAM-dependent methyltransferase